MATTSLFAFRRAMGELLTAELPGGMEILWDAPDQSEDVEGGTSMWWVEPTEVTATPVSMPGGLEETYEQTLAIKVLPADADVGPQDAAEAADELLSVVFDVVTGNPHPVDPADGWDVTVRFAGHTFSSALRQHPPGHAAGFEVRIGVEATRCS